MNRWKLGFTLTEVIVIVAVLGILATITAVGFGKYQSDSRDARRVASVTAISEALEKYYQQNGEYPSCEAIQQSGVVVASEVLDIQASSLTSPRSPSNETNSIKCSTLSYGSDDFFEYQGDGSPDCSGSGSCLSYTLKYINESEGSVSELKSRNQTSIATSNTPTVTVGFIGVDSVQLSWTPVTNASSYQIQRATNNTFTSGLVSFNSSSPSYDVDGLQSLTQYYFRVAGVSNGNVGNWSPVVGAATLSLGAPTIGTTTITSTTQINITWSSVPGALTYRLERSDNSSFTSPVVISGITDTSRSVGSLTTGALYYFRIRAESGATTGSWRTFEAGATNVPTGMTAVASSSVCGRVDTSWNASTGASTQYRLYYSPSSSFSPSYNSATIPTNGQTRNSLDGGVMHYFRARAFVGIAYTNYSTVASAMPMMCAPSAYTVTCSNNGATLTCTSNAVCEGGTIANYYWYLNGNPYQQGDNLQSMSYTPGYDQAITLGVNTRCYNPYTTSDWLGATNWGSFTRGIPAPGAPTWIRHVVSNNTTMQWYPPGCAAGTQVSRVQIIRRSNGAMQWDSGDLWNASSVTRPSLPVASWDSYVFSRCQGANTTSGWGPSALGRT